MDFGIFRRTRSAFTIASGVAAFMAFATPSLAQTIGIGTTQGGATGQIATTIAKIVTEKTELRARPQVTANTSQYVPLVDSGKLEFGIANYPQVYYAIEGTGMSTEKTPNLRLVASLLPFLISLVTPEDSGIMTYADIKGKPVPRFQENSLGDFIIKSTLAAGGLTYDDVESVPVSNFPQQYEAFKDRRTVISIATVGSQASFDLDVAVGGIRFLPNGPKELEIIKPFLPGLYLKDVAANPDLPGLDQPLTVLGYDYLLFAGKDVPNDVVKTVAKALYENEAEFKASGPLFADYDKTKIGVRGVVPMHPGAEAYYNEVGLK